MQKTEVHSASHSLLPYDFVREKNIIALEENKFYI